MKNRNLVVLGIIAVAVFVLLKNKDSSRIQEVAPPGIDRDTETQSSEEPTEKDAEVALQFPLETDRLIHSIPLVQRPNDKIFTDADVLDSLTAAEVSELVDLPAVSLRLVSVDDGALRALIRETTSENPIEIVLLEETPMILVPSVAGEGVEGWQVGMSYFVGSLKDFEHSSAQISIGIDGTVHGHFRFNGNYIRIGEYGRPGQHLIWSRDPNFIHDRHNKSEKRGW